MRASDTFERKLADQKRRAVDARSGLSTDERAHQILKRGWMRGSDLGWELWGETTFAPNRGDGAHGHNKFCRPAGKLLNRLKRQGLAIERPSVNCTLWTAVGKYRRGRPCKTSKRRR